MINQIKLSDMHHVAIFLADGFEEIEAITPIDVLRRANITVTTVSITGNRLVNGAHNIAIQADELFDKMDFDGVTTLVLPGGMPGSTNLNQHEGLKQLLIDFSARGQVIGAICAAPMIAGELGLTKGKKATCYPGFEKHLKGAVHSDAPTCVDGTLVTGKAAGASMKFALQLVELLKDKATAEDLAAKLFAE